MMRSLTTLPGTKTRPLEQTRWRATTPASGIRLLRSYALQYDNVGVGNTAVGFRALWLNTGNGSNTAVGANALGNNTGFRNTALGANAGVDLTDGGYNIDIGADVVGVAGESKTMRIENGRAAGREAV